MAMEQQDELIGFWENDLDDNSGLHNAFGYGIVFLTGGEGIDANWGAGQPYQEDKIVWRRVGPNTIMIKFEQDKEEDTIEYEIANLTNTHGYSRITKKGKEQFWCYPQPMFRLCPR